MPQAAALVYALLPDAVLIGGAMLLLLWAVWVPESAAHQRHVAWASMALVVVTIGLVLVFSGKGLSASAQAPIAVDGLRWYADIVVLIATLGTLALASDYNAREGIFTAEAHVLVLLATAGMMLLAAARDLMLLFLGIELMSIAVYVLAGLNRRSAKAAEAALKYFLLGAFSTGFLLYGIALMYGATGETNLATIGATLLDSGPWRISMLVVGVGLLTVGFGFKTALAPFHMWAPDVYEGAPTPITAYMAAAVKAAAFIAFLRVWREALLGLSDWWYQPLWWIAIMTMAVGNLVALAQRNIKRMLAYSSVAHAGYILVAFAAGTPSGWWAVLFYVAAYTLATLGAFGVVVAVGHAGEEDLSLESYAGLWHVRPALALAMAVFMLALLGFPVFGGVGFFAKWYVVLASMSSAGPGGLSLAIVLVITSVISAGYYLHVITVMFMRPRPEGAPLPAPTPWATRTVIGLSAALILFFGILPAWPVFQAQQTGLQAPSYSTWIHRVGSTP